MTYEPVVQRRNALFLVFPPKEVLVEPFHGNNLRPPVQPLKDRTKLKQGEVNHEGFAHLILDLFSVRNGRAPDPGRATSRRSRIYDVASTRERRRVQMAPLLHVAPGVMTTS